MLSPDGQKLVIEFRQDLESFYQRLQLAPPYHSIEKALSYLATRFQQCTPEEQHQITADAVSYTHLTLPTNREV